MGYLSYLILRELVGRDFAQVTIPHGFVRRLGADQYPYGEGLLDFNGGLNSIDKLLAESIVNLSKATTLLTNLVEEFTSYLYAVGVSHHLWRHWASLTAFGSFLRQDFYRAGLYATLSGEWAFLKALPDVPLDTKQTGDLVTWGLIMGKSGSAIPGVPDGYCGDPWLDLAHSVPQQDHKTTEESLKAIADYWMKETGGDWNNYCYGRYPVFETPICAVAALARHQGFVPISLTSSQYSFLEAGLAEPEPPPMFPGLFSLPVLS